MKCISASILKNRIKNRSVRDKLEVASVEEKQLKPIDATIR